MIQINHNFNMNDFNFLAHFQDVVIEIDWVVDKIFSKKWKKRQVQKARILCLVLSWTIQTMITTTMTMTTMMIFFSSSIDSFQWKNDDNLCRERRFEQSLDCYYEKYQCLEESQVVENDNVNWNCRRAKKDNDEKKKEKKTKKKRDWWKKNRLMSMSWQIIDMMTRRSQSIITMFFFIVSFLHAV